MSDNVSQRRYQIVDFNDLPGVECPCGIARRAFAEVTDYPGTIHLTEIADDARVHYHQTHTETYFIIDCEPDAAMYLDGEVIPVRPACCVLIPAGVRHRAIGRMRILNIVLPKFDPADEHFD